MINEQNTIEFKKQVLDLKSDLINFKKVLNETCHLLSETVLIDNEAIGYSQIEEISSTIDDAITEMSDDVLSLI